MNRKRTGLLYDLNIQAQRLRLRDNTALAMGGTVSLLLSQSKSVSER